jgi:hypothetical protein
LFIIIIINLITEIKRTACRGGLQISILIFIDVDLHRVVSEFDLKVPRLVGGRVVADAVLRCPVGEHPVGFGIKPCEVALAEIIGLN